MENDRAAEGNHGTSMLFWSPTVGALTFDQMFSAIVQYMAAASDARYRLIIGTDSQERDETVFVTAVIVHREGKGARYFYTKERQRKMDSLRQRIMFEASLSLNIAGKLAERISANGISSLDVEIHLDIGVEGQTKDLIREVVGMIVGSGFDAKIKPESYGASKVADKHTK